MTISGQRASNVSGRAAHGEYETQGERYRDQQSVGGGDRILQACNLLRNTVCRFLIRVVERNACNR
jgi:hypothetical protein